MIIVLCMEGRYAIKALISRRLPVDEINRAFDLLQQGEGRHGVIRIELKRGLRTEC